jgi:pyridoxal phosphate enzyme (YggS family)
MQSLQQNYLAVLRTILSHGGVTLIAVSKTFGIDAIRELYDLGQHDFGENYAQEFSQKTNELKDLDIVWHFIGNIQSNKIKLIASNAHWVHSISTTKQIIKLAKHRPINLPKLNILLEVNISNEPSRHGVNSYNELLELANLIQSNNNLKLRGLMGIASDTKGNEIIENQFQKLTNMYQQLNRDGFDVDTLSMGMSNDYELAIKNGSTMIRIGSKIFGSRNH